MRILHLVSSPTLTGPADPALGLAKAQRKHLHVDARLACDRAREGNLITKAEAAGVPIIEGLTLCTKTGPIAALADRRALRALAREYDIVHAHTSHDHALAAAARGRALLVRTIHHGRSAARRGLQGVVYARTDGFIAIAKPFATKLLESYPQLDPERITVIRGAVDCDRFHPNLDGTALRRQHGIPEAAFVFGMIARIKPGRKHDLLLRAFARARAMSRNLRLVLIGKGEGESELRAKVRALDLDRDVLFYGFRDEDLPQAIASCNTTVLLAEGNDAGCRAVLESLACGVPVIGASHSAITEALQGADCGALIPVDDEPALHHALEEAAGAPPDRRRKQSENARARALALYTERARAEAVNAFYEKLRAGAKRR